MVKLSIDTLLVQLNDFKNKVIQLNEQIDKLSVDFNISRTNEFNAKLQELVSYRNIYNSLASENVDLTTQKTEYTDNTTDDIIRLYLEQQVASYRYKFENANFDLFVNQALVANTLNSLTDALNKVKQGVSIVTNINNYLKNL